MDWLKTNWKKLARYGGLGVGCLAVGLLSFVFARYLSSGATFDGALLDLAPQEVSMVVRIDHLPNRRLELERLLEHLTSKPDLVGLESSRLWQSTLGKRLDGGLAAFKEVTWEQGLAAAQRQADRAGAQLFDDVLGGELVLCTDPGARGQEYVALSRVSRGVRARWQFMDIASAFFPDDPQGTRLEYSGGILRVTPPVTAEVPAPRVTLVTLLDDVLVVSNSSRLLNDCVKLHGTPGAGMSSRADYQATLALVDAEAASRHVAGLWLDLDRLRLRLPPDEDGRSPVDSYTALPPEVEGIFPDIFVPVNRIVRHDLDTQPFQAAYYGVDVTEPSSLVFDQYLLVAQDRAAQERYDYLQKTWSQPPAEATQLELLPPDTIMQVSYRQPIEVLYNDVFDDDARASLVGDFLVALRAPEVKRLAGGEVGELAFALAPVSYTPEAPLVPNINIPMPAFALMFRVPGADPQVARALLQEYLYAQRGRARRPGEEPPAGAVQVVEKPVAGGTAYGFHDPREGDNVLRQLNRIIRAAVVEDWLLMTNSEMLLEYAMQSRQGSLATRPGSAWRLVPTLGSASLFLNFDEFADYAGSPDLSRVLRENRYNTALIEGRDPGEVRREIAAEVGSDNLTHPEVNQRYNERKAAWERVCAVEGNRYESAYRADMHGLRFFQDLALITRFANDHLHVRGVLRIG